MSDYSTILVEKREGVTTVRFNRPEKRNAMSPTLHREMYDALSDLQFDAGTQVLVITGKGAADETRTTGRHAEEEGHRGILRRNVPHWLSAPELRTIVLSYTRAGVRHGGAGALYVQLRRGGR